VESLPTGILPPGHLFKPLLADPRWPHFSAAYRYATNRRDVRDVAAVSFGETISLFRGNAPAGQWEFGIQAGVFAVFDLDAESKDLINADYFVAAFGGYRQGAFSALGRVFHQSSHLGDEQLLRDTRLNRINLSYESVDLKLSYDLPLGLRVYGGGGYLFDRDPSSLKPWSAQAGAEFRSPWTLWGGAIRPIAGLDLQSREENNWNVDVSLRAGPPVRDRAGAGTQPATAGGVLSRQLARRAVLHTRGGVPGPRGPLPLLSGPAARALSRPQCDQVPRPGIVGSAT
jgi:hypothetical protein